jgi:hypothetical protein
MANLRKKGNELEKMLKAYETAHLPKFCGRYIVTSVKPAFSQRVLNFKDFPMFFT